MIGIGRTTGSVLGVAFTICVLLVRLYLVRYSVVHDGRRLQPQAAFVGESGGAAPAVPASSWLMFATTDPQTQLRTRHARLRTEPLEEDAAAARPALDYLELQAVDHGSRQAVLTLGSVSETKCSGIDHVGGRFDGGRREVFDVESHWGDAACVLKIGAYDAFVQGLLNAQTLVVTPQAAGATLPGVGFRVAGLSWQQE
jgi:hypothetical protein